MRILLLAPHPFYQERGTPIAVDLLTRVFAKRGDSVDILCYHEGSHRSYEGNVTIHRISNPPFCTNIRPGFSIKKLIADIWMFLKAVRLAKANKYDCIHAVEESVFMAMFIARRHKLPYIFDMDSSMPQQIADKTPFLRFMLPIMKSFEGRAIRKAIAVVPVCDALAEIAHKQGAHRIDILRDISLIDPDQIAPASDLKKELGVTGPLFLYLGNLESYQGIDLMLSAFANLNHEDSSASLAIAGGRPEDIDKYKQTAIDLCISDKIHFLGHKPLNMMSSLLDGADVLVSPRTQGENTPMKIYSYLGSGKAIIATDLPTHTQVLTDKVALLSPPEPTEFGKSMALLANDPELRNKLGTAARKLAKDKYSFAAYEATLNGLYDSLIT